MHLLPESEDVITTAADARVRNKEKGAVARPKAVSFFTFRKKTAASSTKGFVKVTPDAPRREAGPSDSACFNANTRWLLMLTSNLMMTHAHTSCCPPQRNPLNRLQPYLHSGTRHSTPPWSAQSWRRRRGKYAGKTAAEFERSGPRRRPLERHSTPRLKRTTTAAQRHRTGGFVRAAALIRHVLRYVPWRSELRMASAATGIAGTADMIFTEAGKEASDGVIIVD